jgi:predicted small lipoprotein YifL
MANVFLAVFVLLTLLLFAGCSSGFPRPCSPPW